MNQNTIEEEINILYHQQKGIIEEQEIHLIELKQIEEKIDILEKKILSSFK